MKKIFIFVFLSFSLFSLSFASNQNQGIELDQLFDQLKKTNELNTAKEIENKIWKNWSMHSIDEILTETLAIGTELMNRGKFVQAHTIFSNIIKKEPDWAESWNKRATVLYLMKKYQSSLDDIEKALTLEPRHFGALSGQGLVYIKLGEYEKAIESYKKAQKIYPIIDSAKKMIPQLKELIKNEAI